MRFIAHAYVKPCLPSISSGHQSASKGHKGHSDLWKRPSENTGSLVPRRKQPQHTRIVCSTSYHSRATSEAIDAARAYGKVNLVSLHST